MNLAYEQVTTAKVNPSLNSFYCLCCNMHPVSAERMHYLWGFPFACSLVQTHTPPCQWHTKEIQLHIQVQKASDNLTEMHAVNTK
jgi:hypothetical protein